MAPPARSKHLVATAGRRADVIGHGGMSEEIVVIGAGQAGAQLAISLRQGGHRGPIRLICDEPYLPYQRPPLSKKFLAESGDPGVLSLRPESFWREHEVRLELGVAVGAVDLKRRRVALRDGREIAYGTLVFATGTAARILRVPGAALPGVFSLRRIDDVLRLRPALEAAERIVIVGGGYIGLEVAAVVRSAGRRVTVLEAEERVLKRVAGQATAGFFERIHRERGVEIRLGARLLAIEGESRACAVRLAPDERLPADLVLVAAGARPQDELAAAAGLACADGILVDEEARTSAPDVYAIGDCTRFPSRRFGRHVRLESVQNAIDQAKAAAAAILDRPEPYDPVPWFWSDQYDVKLQIAGLADGHDDARVLGDPAAGRFSVEYRRAGGLLAVDAVNDARAHMLARRRIAEETARTAR
jgi:3-phenylpropionate/trans-cinnamate dioxygenase ferredoxin reductase subunit